MALAMLLVAPSLTGCRRVRETWARHSAAGKARARAARQRVRRGRVAYLRYCAICHRHDAQGYAADHANAIGNPAFLAAASDEFLRRSIEEGRLGTPMSPWGVARGGPLDREAVTDIVAFLRSLSRAPRTRISTERANGDLDRGRGLYNARCMRCHSPRGEGTQTVSSVSHPSFLDAASDGFLRHTIEHGRPGTAMEAHPTLSRQELDDLVAYVRSMSHIPGPPPPPEYEPPPSLDHLVINPDGAAPRFTLREDRFVPAAEVAQALSEHRKLIILDARPTSDWSASHIAGSLPFPFYDIEQMATRVPRDGTWVLAYCACPHAASGHVVDELRRRGFEHTAVIDEGWRVWTERGYPTAHAALIHP